MRVAGLRWWAVLLPTVAIIVVDYARHELVSGFIHPWPDEAALLVGVLIVTFATTSLLFERIDRSQRREREAETLRRIGMEITSTLDLDAILASVLTRGREILGVDCLGVALAHSPTRELVMQTRGWSGPRRRRVAEAAAFIWEAMETGESRELHRTTPVSAEGECMFCRRCLAIPLRMGSQKLGALCVGSGTSGPLNVEARNLAEQLANLASAAIANGLLHERAQNVATLEERDRIAREMHDSLAQVLGFLSMKATAARELVGRQEPVRLDEELAEMAQMADDAYLDVREAILGLRESARTSGRLTDALEEYLQKFSRQSGLAVRLIASEGASGALPPRLEIQIVRVIQEALTNVRKHARAGRAWVRLERDDGHLRITIEDDGRGFDRSRAGGQPGGGYGIATMRERVSGIGGRLEIESRPGRGVAIVAVVPLPAAGEGRNGES